MKEQNLFRKSVRIFFSSFMLFFIFLQCNKALEVQAEADVLKDGGIYYIEPKCAPGKVLDVKGQSIANETIVHIWKKLPQDNQKVKATSLGNGYYKFTFLHSGKCLDVRGNNSANKTRVQQYLDNSSSAQQWLVKSADNGYFYIINKNGKYLDVDNSGGFKDGNYMQIYQENKTSDQMFRFIETTSRAEDYKSGLLKNGGLYYIEPQCAPGKVLDVKSQSKEDESIVHIWRKLPQNNQLVKATFLGDGYYKFTFVHSGKCLDVKGNESADKTRVHQFTDNGTSAQQWLVKSAGNGYFYIINKNGKYLDVDNGSGFKDGNYMQIYKEIGGSDQKFKFIAVNSAFRDTSSSNDYILPVKKGTSTITQGYKSSHQALDIASYGSTFEEKQIDIFAIKSGTVTATYTSCTHNEDKANWSCGCGGHGGNYVIINHGSGITSTYMHLSSVAVKKGDSIKSGDVIGKMGSTGRSTGVHLHLVIRKNGSAVNPNNYIDISKL